MHAEAASDLSKDLAALGPMEAERVASLVARFARGETDAIVILRGPASRHHLLRQVHLLIQQATGVPADDLLLATDAGASYPTRTGSVSQSWKPDPIRSCPVCGFRGYDTVGAAVLVYDENGDLLSAPAQHRCHQCHATWQTAAGGVLLPETVTPASDQVVDHDQ